MYPVTYPLHKTLTHSSDKKETESEEESEEDEEEVGKEKKVGICVLLYPADGDLKMSSISWIRQFSTHITSPQIL